MGGAGGRQSHIQDFWETDPSDGALGAFHVPDHHRTAQSLIDAGHLTEWRSLTRHARKASYIAGDIICMRLDLEPVEVAPALTATAAATAVAPTPAPLATNAAAATAGSGGGQKQRTEKGDSMSLPRVFLTFYKNGAEQFGGRLLLPAAALEQSPHLYVFSTVDRPTDACELYGIQLLG